MNAITNDLLIKYKNSDIETRFNLFSKTVKSFTITNEKLNLKAGDIITFWGGYDNDIPYKSKVLGFNSKGRAFVLWDCFWADIDLIERKYIHIK